MHSLIDDILQSSRARGPGAGEGWPVEERRDLVASARAARGRGTIPIIAEIKPKALGRTLAQEEVAAYARAYAQYGACAISVLTEPTHFLGRLENARTARQAGLPVLRKDFIFSEEQLSEVQADLVLLIAALNIDLDDFIAAARAIGMEPLVEVHSEEELERALGTEAEIIGINNRNLKTLEVDLETFERLAPRAREAGVFLVAESGVHSPEDARRMVQAGADALLVGTELMAEPRRLKEINRL
ncbi:indole-3-glycerol-phosphate synthase [Methanothrix sp.]|uniref:indole-3-glycerol-phosphate synthase n=1 Tax=Methanothrix sp. TaxID=90426 RepID=UPI001BD280ED